MRAALAATILVLASAVHAATTRQLAILDDWEGVKAKAQRLRDHFLAAVRRDRDADVASFEKGLSDAWTMSEDIEKRERARRRILSQSLMLARSLGDISDEEFRSRQDAVDRLFEVRMVVVYGDMFPRILDEAHDRGREYAGPEWEQAVTQQEGKALNREFSQATGFPPEKLEGVVDGR